MTNRPNTEAEWRKILYTHSAWRSCKRQTVLMEDIQIRDCLTQLVESTTALTDPFANDIMYHPACWKLHISNTNFQLENAIHLQGVCLAEARNLVFFTCGCYHLADNKRIVVIICET